MMKKYYLKICKTPLPENATFIPITTAAEITQTVIRCCPPSEVAENTTIYTISYETLNNAHREMVEPSGDLGYLGYLLVGGYKFGPSWIFLVFVLKKSSDNEWGELVHLSPTDDNMRSKLKKVYNIIIV
jgi:hypothetical protein